MLRDFSHTLDALLLRDIFDQFDIARPMNLNEVVLLKFEIITPDSFLWKFLIGNEIYYLYAEDFVEGLEEVRSTVSKLTKDDSDFEFIKVKEPKQFKDSGPYKSAEAYSEPKNIQEFMEYAADADFDFVFLVKSTEDSSDSYFAE